ncbi:MAG TPA: hypothetical protein VMX17_11820, partial [Candidatus Glassbacteria bacterium]|nr:hypothetical protein [Candidatus Glassbacteria bacterium]
MTVGFNTAFKKETNIYFIIRNTSIQHKTINIFGLKIPYNAPADLLALPQVSEADIRHSLIKGDLADRIRNKDIRIIESNIDLLQFSDDQKQFLVNAGLVIGAEIPDTTAVLSPYDDTLAMPPLSVDNVQDAIDVLKGSLTPILPTPQKLVVGQAGNID